MLESIVAGPTQLPIPPTDAGQLAAQQPSVRESSELRFQLRNASLQDEADLGQRQLDAVP